MPNKKSFCTLFPDSWHVIIDFDIANICEGHDMLYEKWLVSRKAADKWLYDQLMLYKPEYKVLWDLVYLAVRRFGWIPWTLHKVQRHFGLLGFRGQTGWTKVRQVLEANIPLEGFLAHYA